jgi:hypothetical protein
MKKYLVVLNDDRVHISFDGVPVETFIFSDYMEGTPTFGVFDDDAKQIAVGVAVCKALEINKGPVTVHDVSKF